MGPWLEDPPPLGAWLVWASDCPEAAPTQHRPVAPPTSMSRRDLWGQWGHCQAEVLVAQFRTEDTKLQA